MAENLKPNINVKKHSISLDVRERLSVSGVTDVVSFDESCIVLSTECGILSVDGASLRVISLDTDKGDVMIEGSVNGLIYPDGMTKGGLFRRRQK